ncbi:MAG TPA: hypothetical protein VFD52_06835 [Clostridia bacterium]|nr:hypothetical protein [Clostridia bacterium]
MPKNENATMYDDSYEQEVNTDNGSSGFLNKAIASYNNLKPWAKIVVPSFVLIVIVAISVALFFALHSDIKLSAQISDLYADDRILPTYQKFPEHYEGFLVDQVGLDNEQAAQLLRGNENWRFFTLKIEFNNKHKYPVDIYRFNVVDNGKNKIWINPILNGIIGLEPGLDEIRKINIEVIVGDPSLDLMEVLRLTGDLEASVEYSRRIGYGENGKLMDAADESSMEQPPSMFAELKNAE